jgi:hypothetical protein
MPMTLVPPGISSVAPTNVSNGLVEPNTYYFVLTTVNDYGETVGSNEMSTVVAAPNNAVLINFYGSPGNIGNFRLYIGLAQGAEASYINVPNDFTGAFIWNTSTSTLIAGYPPQRSTAWMPDTDGALISAFAIYGWLNDGLRVISRVAGGLLDYSGVGSVSNVPMYTIPGEWVSITGLWYNGYWLLGGDRNYFWRRNNITSAILSSGSISVINNQNILEVYPQPDRDAAVTSLTAPMGTTDTVASVANVGGFLLPFGFMQVDSEIIGYQKIVAGQFINLIRGLGGTPASAHQPGALVQELNIFWSGKRQIEPAYQPGQSATLLPLPSGWDVLLAQYVSGRAKNIEHDGQYWQQLEQSIRQSITDWARQNKGVMRRRQVGPPTSPATYYATPAGGLIIQ